LLVFRKSFFEIAFSPPGYGSLPRLGDTRQGRFQALGADLGHYDVQPVARLDLGRAAQQQRLAPAHE